MQQMEIMREMSPDHLGPVACATPKASAIDPFEAFLAPGDVFRKPSEVLACPWLSPAEKRAILASWASDARALDSCPNLRCLPGCRAEPVPIDTILSALQALDGRPGADREPRPRRRGLLRARHRPGTPSRPGAGPQPVN